MEDKSVLVTGGAGFIGSHIVDRLVSENPRRIVVVDNFFHGNPSNLDEAKANFKNLKVYDSDATDEKAMEKIIKDNAIDIVFNSAVVPILESFDKPKWTYEQNIGMVTVACELLRRGAYKTLIHISSSEAYGTAMRVPMDEGHPLNPTTPYAASKVAGDMLAMSYFKLFKLDISIIRPFNTFGPRQEERGVIPMTVSRVLNKEAPVVQGDGKQTRDYIYVTDVADATLKTYKTEKTRGKIMNVGSGKEIQIGALIKMIADIMGCSKKIKYEESRPSDVRRHLADITLAKKLIDFKPKVSFEDGLKKTVEWYSERLS